MGYRLSVEIHIFFLINTGLCFLTHYVYICVIILHYLQIWLFWFIQFCTSLNFFSFFPLINLFYISENLLFLTFFGVSQFNLATNSVIVRSLFKFLFSYTLGIVQKNFTLPLFTYLFFFSLTYCLGVTLLFVFKYENSTVYFLL